MGHTLLVFFNNMRSHWLMMFIHLASLCLTSSGGGPTLLTQDSAQKHQVEHIKHETTTFNTRMSASLMCLVHWLFSIKAHLTGDL